MKSLWIHYAPSISFTAEGFIWSINQYGRVSMATTSAKAAYSAAHAMGEIKRMALDSFIVFDLWMHFEDKKWKHYLYGIQRNADSNILIRTHPAIKIHMPEDSGKMKSHVLPTRVQYYSSTRDLPAITGRQGTHRTLFSRMFIIFWSISPTAT